MSDALRPAEARAGLLTIPGELRNQIYMYIFEPEDEELPSVALEEPDVLAVALKLQDKTAYTAAYRSNSRAARQLNLLSTCKQIYNEAQLLALSMTPFHLTGEITYPDLFDLRSRSLTSTKIGAIRHLTLTARISHLRALNEAWAGLPFGHISLNLDRLVIVPRRPQVCTTAYAEIADLSQSHTLAYVFCETLKGLRNVKCVEVRNQGCFSEVVWRLFYRSLVYRMWRWGGGKCGIKFQCGEETTKDQGRGDEQWFRAYLKGGKGVNEVGEEVVRLVGLTGELPDPSLAGAGP